MFEMHPEFLAGDRPEWGRIAMLPWDTDTFGFGVADYEIAAPERERLGPCSVRAALEAWSSARDVELVGTAVPASDTAGVRFFERVGFHCIETTLTVRFDDIGSARAPSPVPSPGLLLAPAGDPDLAAILRIAGRAFHHGRYHADPRFPGPLADRRYRDWVLRTQQPQSPQILLAARAGADVCGFSIVEAGDGRGYLHLYAVDPSRTGNGFGTGIVAGALAFARQRGSDSLRTRISAANTASMNIMARLGARFLDPQVRLHWHATGSERSPRSDASCCGRAGHEASPA